MTIDKSREDYWREMQRRQSDLGGGGSRPPPPDIEVRVARIESDIEHIKADTGRMSTDINELKKTTATIQIDVAKGIGEVRSAFASLDERSKHFTTKWDVVLMLAVLFGLLSGVVALAVRFIPSAG